MNLSGNESPTCGKNHTTTMTIQGNRINWKYFGGFANFVDVEVKPDGTFSGGALNSKSHLVVNLKGQVSGNVIQADTASGYCNYHLTLKKKKQ